MSATLYVGHVAYETTEVSLQTIFERAGTVVSCDLVRDNFSGRPMGFAYVEMSSESEALRAVEQLNGEELNGRKIHVNRAIDFPMYRPASRSVLSRTANV
jgi:RNA recognition motif-containing protein